MIWSWLDRRVFVLLAVIATIAMLYGQRDGVREVRRANDLSNFALVDPRPGEDDWPCWRGSSTGNVATSGRFPKVWQPGSTDDWKVKLSGNGRATPIVWGSQIFVLLSENDGGKTVLRSYDRTSGKENWQTLIFREDKRPSLEKMSVESSTPACDGQYVYVASVFRGRLWVSSIDMAGQIAWQREIGRYLSAADHESSPVLFQSYVIVAVDQQKGSYLAAIHRQTGQIIWRVRRPDGESSGSPIVSQLAGRAQLVLPGRKAICSYDPATGDLNWIYRWGAERVANSVAFDQDRVYATCSSPLAEVVCVDASGIGDVTDTHLVWQQLDFGGEVPSPTYFQGHLYVLSDEGTLRSLDATTGAVEWRKKLTGPFTASPLVADNCLICINGSGLCYLIQPASPDELIAENQLPDAIMGSPIVAGDSVILRTTTGISRFTAPPLEPIVEKPDRSRRKL